MPFIAINKGFYLTKVVKKKRNIKTLLKESIKYL